DPAAAVLTVGVLLYSAPVLARLYSDPGFNRFQWRAAASLVEHQGKPGDFFLYVNNATRSAFTFYYREPHPSLTLTAADLDPAAAVLTVGVLLYSAPVLARLYSDPGFNRFQWRAAASLVEHQGKPGDFFLYVNNATRSAFTFYYREPHPSLTLTAANLVPGGD